MSRCKRLSHTIWHCEYHIVRVPKYRYRVMQGKIKEEVELCVRDQTRQMNCEVQELNVQADHVHLIVLSPSGTKPARGERFKTGHSEVRIS
jgi:putative transposase